MDEDDELNQEARVNKAKDTLNKGKSKLLGKIKEVFNKHRKLIIRAVLIIVDILIIFNLIVNSHEKEIFKKTNSAVRTAIGALDTDGDGVPDEDIDFAKFVKIEKVDGEYCVKIEKEVFEKIEKQLEENNIKPTDLNIKTGNFDCFKEFIKAEITTQFPQLGNIDKEKHKDDEDIITDGVIKIKRAKDGQTDSNATQLFYTPQEDFKKLCDDNDSKALEYFSLDDERNLLYASYEQTDITVTSSGDTSIIEIPSNQSTYVITMQTMDYRSVVRKYTMPFSLQLAILQTSDSENFALEFSRLAENSEMVITIQDNIEKNTYVEDIEAEQHIEGTKKIDYKINVADVKVTTVYKSDGTVLSGPTAEAINHGAVEDVKGQNITYDPEQKNCTATVTTVVETNTPVLELTKVDCWNAKFENTYSYSDNTNNPEESTAGPSTTTTEEDVPCDINTDPDIAKFITERENYWKNLKPADSDTTDSTTGNRTVIKYTRTVTSEKSNLVSTLKRVTNKTSTVKTTTIKKEYTTTKNAAESNEERIFRIFTGEVANDHDELNDQQKKEYKKELQEAFESLHNGQLWFYGLLKEDPQTKEFVDIMKYFIKKGNDDPKAGEFDFSDYDGEELTDVSDFYGDCLEDKIWVALKDIGLNDVAAASAMGNMSYESGGWGNKKILTDTVEGGYNEYNGGIGMCQWTNYPRNSGKGRNAELRKYAQSKNKPWTDEDTQIEFLIAEIVHKGKAKNYTKPEFYTRTYGGVTYPANSWKRVSNDESKIEYATKAFAATFEGPSEDGFITSMTTRVSCSKYFYNKYKGKTAKDFGSSTGEFVQYYQDDYADVPYGTGHIDTKRMWSYLFCNGSIYIIR